MPTAQPDAALETLAAVFRTMPRYPVVSVPTDAALYGEHDAWARHLLTGAPPPGLDSGRGAPRQLAQAQLFFRQRRQAEQACVAHREREYSGLALDLLGALREASTLSGATAGAVEAGLQRAQTLLAHNEVDLLRAEFAGMADQLRTALATQRAQLDEQIGQLHERLRAAEEAREQVESQARALGSNLAELRQALDDARQQMQLDPLTQIYNRGAFDAALRRYADLAAASGQHLVLLDLDHFKRVNDRFGHPAGDAVLVAFADLLSRSFLRSDDFVARYGGEEFAVLLLVSDAARVPRLVGDVLNRLRELRVPLLGGECALTCSGGFAVLDASGDCAGLVKRADQALYQAKRDGRDCLRAAA